MATQTQAPAGNAAPAGKAAPVLKPFRAGTQPTVKATGYSQTVTLTAATQPLPDYQVAPTHILRAITIEVKITAAGNSATVAFQPDAPLNIFQTINFQDAGGTSIVGSFDSFTLAMSMKYFGYAALNGDPRQNAVYSVTTGSGATGGSATLVLRIPVEAVNRTGVGSLRNESTNSPFVLSATINTLAATYSTAPTVAPTVNVVYRLHGYWNGGESASDAQPAPRAYGSTQYINRASYLALNGGVTQQLAPVGLGNPWRNLMFINYATGGARAGAGTWPDPMQLTFRGVNLRQSSLLEWQYEISEDYELSGAIDTGNGLDTGVYVQTFVRDFSGAPGDEVGTGYLVTAVGDEFQLIGTWGASSTMYEVVNYISPNGAPSQLVGMV
jgi:hypothetical protein